MHYLWVSPIMTIIATYILWREAEWAGILGLFTILLIVPIQSKHTNDSFFFNDEKHTNQLFQEREMKKRENTK